MSDSTPYVDLDLEEDLTLQRREWRWRRVGWAVLFSIVGAALVGVFGDGFLSDAKAVSSVRGDARSPALTVDFQRFTRVGKSARIAIRLAGTPPENGDVALKVDRRFYDHAQIERLTPEPDRVVPGAKTVDLVFASGKLRAGSGIVLDYQPTAAGLHTLRFGVGDSVVEMTQFTYF